MSKYQSFRKMPALFLAIGLSTGVCAALLASPAMADGSGMKGSAAQGSGSDDSPVSLTTMLENLKARNSASSTAMQSAGAQSTVAGDVNSGAEAVRTPGAGAAQAVPAPSAGRSPARVALPTPPSMVRSGDVLAFPDTSGSYLSYIDGMNQYAARLEAFNKVKRLKAEEYQVDAEMALLTIQLQRQYEEYMRGPESQAPNSSSMAYPGVAVPARGQFSPPPSLPNPALSRSFSAASPESDIASSGTEVRAIFEIAGKKKAQVIHKGGMSMVSAGERLSSDIVVSSIEANGIRIRNTAGKKEKTEFIPVR